MRVLHWPQVLQDKVEEWRNIPFAYGTADCCQFTADVILAIAGVDYRVAFGVYTSKEEADAFIETAGGMLALLTAALGEPKHISRAMRGDVVLMDFAGLAAPAICLGSVSCAIGEKGLLFQETRMGRMAWTI